MSLLANVGDATRRINGNEFGAYALGAAGGAVLGAIAAAISSPPFPSFVLFSAIFSLIILGFFDIRKMIVAYLFLIPLININLLLQDVEFLPALVRTSLPGKGMHFDGIALLLVVVFWVAQKRKMPAGFPFDKMFYGLWLVFLVVTALAIVANRERSPFGQIWNLVELSAYMGICLVFISEFRDRKVVRHAVLAMALGISIASFSVMFNVFLRNVGFDEIPFYYWSQRTIDSFKGTINHRNLFGGMLLLILPLSIAWLAYVRGKFEFYLWSLCVALQATGFAVTRSKGGMAGLLVFGLVFMARVEWTRKIKFIFFAWILAVVLAGNYFAVRSFESSWSVRNYVYRVSLPLVADAPLLGHGLNSFPETFLKYERKSVKGKLPSLRYTKEGKFLGGFSSHNSFLTQLAEKGFLGFLSFIALLAFPIFSLLRNESQEGRGHHPVTIAAGAAIVGLCVQAVTDDVLAYSKVFVLLWAVFAAGMAVGERDWFEPVSDGQEKSALPENDSVISGYGE